LTGVSNWKITQSEVYDLNGLRKTFPWTVWMSLGYLDGYLLLPRSVTGPMASETRKGCLLAMIAGG